MYLIKLKGPRGYPKDITPERMFRKIKKRQYLNEVQKIQKSKGISDKSLEKT